MIQSKWTEYNRHPSKMRDHSNVTRRRGKKPSGIARGRLQGELRMKRSHGVRIRKPGAVLNPRHGLLVKGIGVMNKLLAGRQIHDKIRIGGSPTSNLPEAILPADSAWTSLWPR
jgi:hypothetical protein